MKRKLFTMLMALLALASFQANVQAQKYLIWAGDTTHLTAGTNFGISKTGFDPGTNYANVGNLNWPAKLTIKSGIWMWEAGTPKNTDIKFTLDQSVGANFTQFKEALKPGQTGTGSTLSLTYKDKPYSNFVIFRGLTSFWIDTPWNPGGTNPQGDTIKHAGYLSINTATVPRDADLVIVLVKTTSKVISGYPTTKGTLLLETVQFLRDNRNDFAPFAFYAYPARGHWATTADFEGSKYWDFNLKVAPDTSVAKNIALPNSEYAYTFTPTQVDWVAKKGNKQSGENIFGNVDEKANVSGAAYYNTKFDSIAGKGNLGLQTNARIRSTDNNDPYDSVIPLFILSSPAYGCKVVSVSRINDLDRQVHVDGGYANRLELREYGAYYDYFHGTGNTTYTKHTANLTNLDSLWDWHHTGSPRLQAGRVATSLQKFAIWVDEDGRKTIYPAASYAWEYGNVHKDQPSKVLPNSVLMYNNIDITSSTGGTVVADQGWGIQIDKWLAATVNGTKQNDPVTGPNALQFKTDYDSIQINPTPHGTPGKTLIDKFFFLDVPGLQPNKAGDSHFSDATQGNAYQDLKETQYVLSTEVDDADVKHLIVLPKEKVRSYANGTNYWYNTLQNNYKRIEGGRLLTDYWSNNPYDSVNMAAHWAFYEKGTNALGQKLYLLVNMMGDTLQYNVGTNLNTIVGGYLTVSNAISRDGLFSKEGNAANPWFTPNTAVSSPTTTKSLWTITGVPGKESAGFVLNLDGYDLTIQSGAWYRGSTHAKTNINAVIDSLYYQQDVSLVKSSTAVDTVLVSYNNDLRDNFSCAGGTILDQSPIYYVPNYSKSFGGETENTGNSFTSINTSDPTFIDRDAKVDRDSLTAYLLLHGFYGVEEASAVGNGLLLGSDTVEYKNVHAAAFKTSGKTNVEFIPLVTVAKDRNALIRTAIGTDGTLTPGAAIDTLRGETYKWFIVKLGDEYLKFDTISPDALNNRLKVGFTFEKVSLANATPVRLYQPLVGDKLQGNFLFQFYSAVNTYGDSPATSYVNTWPEINSNIMTASEGGGKRLFGQLSDQSRHINGIDDKSKATRFTYTWEKPEVKPCNCPEEFVSPKFMAREKLLGLPIQNQIWLQTGTNYNFNDAKTKNSLNETEAIANERTEANYTNLTHIYVDSIKRNGYAKGTYTYRDGGNNLIPITGFYKDLGVYLYQVRNADGKYLTVGKSTYQYNSKQTANDVTGVNLVWSDSLYTNKNLNPKNQALQLFAIVGPDSLPKDSWYSCGTYVYLPLASYKVDYANGKVLTDSIYFNLNLGKKDSTSCYEKASDVTKAFRVTQYSQVDKEQKNLIVANASGGNTDVVPVEVKWKKNTYLTLDCPEYQKVKNVSTGNYYYANNAIGDKVADDYTILAHWKWDNKFSTDPQLYKFVAEGLTYYGNGMLANSSPLAQGKYYITKKDGNTYRVVNFAGFEATPNWIDSANYKTTEEVFEITCVEHALPFFDLEKDGGFALPEQKLSILETPYKDRSLSDHAEKLYEAIEKGGSFQAYLNKIGNQIDSATQLRAYKTMVRKLGTAGHEIPYFAFSLTAKNGKEYFLNVVPKKGVEYGDSIYWTWLDYTDRAKLVDTTTYKNNQESDIKAATATGALDKVNRYGKFFKYYQFCLPYQWKDGKFADSVEYASGKYVPVYLQTLDNARNDDPYLVIAGAATSYATTVTLNNAYLASKGGTTIYPPTGLNNTWGQWNIYSVDYRNIDPMKVTAWIFGGQKGSDHEWVPLYDPTSKTHGEEDVDGLLLNYKPFFAGQQQPGIAFVSESNDSPVNYGVLLGKTVLHFERRGQETIGNPFKKPIYYYGIRVKYADAAKGTLNETGKKWLTDSWKSPDKKYEYSWGQTEDTRDTYYLAHFSDMLSKDLELKYDGKFIQTFGLRYFDAKNAEVSSDTLPTQTFVVVSNADYTKKPTNEGTYRYLAEVNGHLVFVEGFKNALVFQFGRDTDGNYTGIEVVGQGNVLGVSGGVRILDQTGKVDLYSVDGSLIKSVVVTGADQTITAPRGVVIVKVAGKATKVIVK